MPEKTSKKRAKVKKVLEEFKKGELKSSSGEKVVSQEQAVAIALSEAKVQKTKKAGDGVVVLPADVSKSPSGNALLRQGYEELYGNEE